MQVSPAMVAATALATIVPALGGWAQQVPPSPPQAPGSLSISAPATANIGSVTLGGALSSQLGPVTVTDQRTASGTWTATVTSTNFTTAHGTITNSNLKYWSGPATTTSGPGTFTPGQSTAANAVVLNTTRTAFTRTGSNGNNSATWNPTLVITVPVTAAAGTYTGTITHSVA